MGPHFGIDAAATLRRVTSGPRRSLACAAVGLGLTIGACGSDDNAGVGPGDGTGGIIDSGPNHVHGLGINPQDGALFIATHTGLFRAAPGERRSARVADRYQDTMGFAVVGANRFLGSGHPDLRERRPPFLGLIESRDAGATWRSVSLLGKRDFHVLEGTGRRIFGFGSDFQTREESLLVSSDSGRSWQQRATPESLLTLAIDPDDPDRIVVSGASRMYASTDAGRRWRPIPGPSSLVVWPRGAGLIAIDRNGLVRRSQRPGAPWREAGELGGGPAAFEAVGPDELYAALHDGTVKRSTDGGASWSVRALP